MIEWECIQLREDSIECPILPPDSQECLQRGPSVRIAFDNVKEAREAYKIGMGMRASKYNRRKFLNGGCYRNIFFDNGLELDVRKYGGNMNLNIAISDGKVSVLKIRDLSGEREMLKVIKDFSEKSNKDSGARCNSGDSGSMFAFGMHGISQGDYISMKDEAMMDCCRTYNIIARNLLDKYFKEDVKDIIEADRRQGIVPSESMGGKDGISAYSLVSRDLVNAAHYDLDTSVGISIFNERIPGLGINWFFILPNTIVEGGSKDKAIMIKLFDGCTLSWDGRDIFHCTGTLDVGSGNHLYGNYWGGKVYR